MRPLGFEASPGSHAGFTLQERAESDGIEPLRVAPRLLSKQVDPQDRGADIPYLVSGSAVAAGIAPVAPTRLASVYVEDPDGAAKVLGLRAADAGANVVLLQPRG